MSATVWIHLISLSLYALATAALALYFVPRARAQNDPQHRLASIVAVMKVYDPFSIAILGVIIMTGAFALTSLKDALRERFFQVMGPLLIWKLGITFVVIIIACYLAFGLGNRLVGRVELEEQPTAAWISSMLARIQVVSVSIVALCGAAAWIATSW